MGSTSLGFEDWIEWYSSISRPETLTQLGAILVAGLLALLLTHLGRRLFLGRASAQDRHFSVIFGRRDFDGVLFPALWLLLANVAPYVLDVPLRYSLFRVALPVLVALLLIRLGAKILRAAFHEARWVLTLERRGSWLIWLGMVLWVSGILPVFLEQLESISFKLGNSQFDARSLLEGALMVGLTLLLTLWLSALAEQQLMRNATGSMLSLRKIMSNVLRAAMMIVGIIVSLSIAGIDLTALSVFGGALGVGIGLGLQKLASNYVSGFVILAERSIRIGDTVKVDGFEGRISDITARYTLIRSLTGVEAILPNETLVTQRVENNSLADRQVWVSTTVAVGYDSEIDLVQRLLVEAALGQPRVLREPPPAANLENFGADGLEFRLGFWIRDPENGTGLLRSEINKQILQSLRAHKVEIPFPQRVVHHQGLYASGGGVESTAAALHSQEEGGHAPAAKALSQASQTEGR